MNFAKRTKCVTLSEKLVPYQKSIAAISDSGYLQLPKNALRRSRVLHDRRVIGLRQRRLVRIRRLNRFDGFNRLRKTFKVPLFSKVLDRDEFSVEPPAVQSLERTSDSFQVTTADVNAAVTRRLIDRNVKDSVIRSAFLEDRIFDRDVPVVAILDVDVEHVADLEASGERRVALDFVAVLPKRLTLPDLGHVGRRRHPAPDDEFYTKKDGNRIN